MNIPFLIWLSYKFYMPHKTIQMSSFFPIINLQGLIKNWKKFFRQILTSVLFGWVMEFYQNNGYSYAIFLANIFKSFCNSNNHGVSWFVVQQRLTTNNGFENAAQKEQSWFHFSPGHSSSKCRNFSVGTLIQQKCILVLGTEQILVLNKIFLVWMRNVFLFWKINVFQKEEWNP